MVREDVFGCSLPPIMEYDPSDERWHISIPRKASIPFLTVDIAADIALTGFLSTCFALL